MNTLKPSRRRVRSTVVLASVLAMVATVFTAAAPASAATTSVQQFVQNVSWKSSALPGQPYPFGGETVLFQTVGSTCKVSFMDHLSFTGGTEQKNVTEADTFVSSLESATQRSGVGMNVSFGPFYYIGPPYETNPTVSFDGSYPTQASACSSDADLPNATRYLATSAAWTDTVGTMISNAVGIGVEMGILALGASVFPAIWASSPYIMFAGCVGGIAQQFTYDGYVNGKIDYATLQKAAGACVVGGLASAVFASGLKYLENYLGHAGGTVVQQAAALNYVHFAEGYAQVELVNAAGFDQATLDAILNNVEAGIHAHAA